MVIYYKGEDISLQLKSDSDISGYTKVVKFFTPFSSPISATVTEIDAYNFTASITDTQSATLKTGTLNIVVEFSSGGNTIISKTVECQLNDAYMNGGARESINQSTYSVNFNESTLELIFDVINYNSILSLIAFRVVADITERNAIPSILRRIGNRVNVISNGLTYKLEGGITNSDWKVCAIDCELVGKYSQISSSSNTKLSIVENDEIWSDTNTVYLKNNGILTKFLTLQES